MNELDDTDQEARAQLLAPKLCKGINTVEARNSCDDLYAWYGPLERNTVINRAQWLSVNEPATYCPDWIYHTRQDLDLQQLEKLGAARPLWTHHFTTWQAFKNYIAGVEAGNRLSNSEWFSLDDFNRASRELASERRANSSKPAPLDPNH